MVHVLISVALFAVLACGKDEPPELRSSCNGIASFDNTLLKERGKPFNIDLNIFDARKNPWGSGK